MTITKQRITHLSLFFRVLTSRFIALADSVASSSSLCIFLREALARAASSSVSSSCLFNCFIRVFSFSDWQRKISLWTALKIQGYLTTILKFQIKTTMATKRTWNLNLLYSFFFLKCIIKSSPFEKFPLKIKWRSSLGFELVWTSLLHFKCSPKPTSFLNWSALRLSSSTCSNSSLSFFSTRRTCLVDCCLSLKS